jgi:hypothetical protein
MASVGRVAEKGRGGGAPGEAPLPPGVSAGKKWRFRRDLVIYLAHKRNGLSQRFLADVFDLPRSRIAVIIQNFSKYDRGDGMVGELEEE